jgi:LysR family positive regulator for ilvC
MNTDQLRHFLTLADALHFGRASREAHLSPSALSRSIQRLEEEVGQPLFERDNRNVALTAAGHAFGRYANGALASWESVQTELRSTQTRLSGRLSIFATVTACYSFLPDALTQFRTAHPDVQIRLQTGNAEQALAQLDAGAIDVAVAPMPERLPARFTSQAVARTSVVLVASRSAPEIDAQLSRRPIPWSEVPLVLPEFGLARRYADRWFRARRIRPRIQHEVEGNEAILSLVALGCGVGVVPQLVIENSPLRDRVRSVDVRPRLPQFQIAFCTLARRLEAPLLAAFWRSVRD